MARSQPDTAIHRGREAHTLMAGAPIGPNDGRVRECVRDLLSLHAVQRELQPYKLAAGFGQVGRALDILLAADAQRGGHLAAFAMPRASLAHQLKLVLSENGRTAM